MFTGEAGIHLILMSLVQAHELAEAHKRVTEDREQKLKALVQFADSLQLLLPPSLERFSVQRAREPFKPLADTHVPLTRPSPGAIGYSARRAVRRPGASGATGASSARAVGEMGGVEARRGRRKDKRGDVLRMNQLPYIPMEKVPFESPVRDDDDGAKF